MAIHPIGAPGDRTREILVRIISEVMANRHSAGCRLAGTLGYAKLR